MSANAVATYPSSRGAKKPAALSQSTHIDIGGHPTFSAPEQHMGSLYAAVLFGIYVVYMIMLLVLTWHFAYDNGWVWFLIIHLLFVGIVFYLWDRDSDSDTRQWYTRHPSYKYLQIIVAATATLHIYVLGLLTAHYSRAHAEFAWVFPLLMFLLACFVCVFVVGKQAEYHAKEALMSKDTRSDK
jgi:hypothetical protein